MSFLYAAQADGTVHQLADHSPDKPLLDKPGGPYARVIADSISAQGHRVTTLTVKLARRNQAEFNTHAFVRNSASSRARPVASVRAMTKADPAWPLDFGSAQPGMDSNLDAKVDADKFLGEWWAGLLTACAQSDILERLKVSKEECNRPLEAYNWTEIVVTATDWAGFFSQRAHRSASAHLRAAAYAMQEAMAQSTPRFLRVGEWHLPFVDTEFLDIETACRCSAARCARVSFVRHGAERSSIGNDLELFNRLVDRDVGDVVSNPPHWSPLGHQCTPSWLGRNALGGLTGFDQFRHLVEARLVDSLHLVAGLQKVAL